METKRSNEQLVREIQAGKNELLDTLINQNMGMVVAYSKSMALYNQLSYDDEEELKQVGMIKIMEAAKTFNASCNTKFISYATLHICGGMIDWIRDNKSFIHIPNYMRARCSAYEDAVEQFSAQNKGRLPSDQVLMKALKADEIELVIIRDTIKALHVGSLDVKIETDEHSVALEELIEDKEDKYLELLCEQDKHRMFSAILKLKNGKERKVVIDEFYNEKRLVDIAAEMNVTPARVQNLKKNAMANLMKLPEIIDMAKEYGIKVRRLD